jgi:hypothetical protein
MASPRKPVLAICGGGNAGHALAVAASRRLEHDIVWLVRSDEKAQLLRDGVFGAGLHSTGAIEGRADRVRAISSEAAEIIPSADIVILAVPAYAHAPILRRIAPHLKGDALIGAVPTRGGFEFEVSHLVPGIEPNGERIVFGLQTLPWSTRVQEPGRRVNFGAVKAKVLMATRPAKHACRIGSMLTGLLGTEIAPTDSFLNMTLGNPGQIVHPGLMYGLFHSWNGKRYTEATIPRLYADATDEIGAFVERLSADAVAVAQEVESKSEGALDLSGVLPVLEWLRISYPTQTADISTVATCFRTGPIQARKAPTVEVAPDSFVPNFQYRYLSEDVPYGLAVTKAIAQLARVRTPAIDAVLRWARGHGVGAGVQSLPIPQNYGIRGLQDLIEVYLDESTGSPLVASAV